MVAVAARCGCGGDEETTGGRLRLARRNGRRVRICRDVIGLADDRDI